MGEESELLTKTAVLARGWTASLIRDYLGEPDARSPNPHFRKAAEVCLFKLERILAAEKRDDFAAALERSRARSRSAMKGVERQREELCGAVRGLSITVETMSLKQARRLACQNYNEHQLGRGSDSDPVAPETVEPAFLDRITVNFLRHCCTNYDSDVDSLSGRTGRDRARHVLKARTLSEIAATYPALASECESQKAKERE